MEIYNYFPIKKGGMYRKAASNQTANEKEFVVLTANHDRHSEADRLILQQTVKKFFLNQES